MREKLAVQVLLASIVTVVEGFVPEQAPVQLSNWEPALGVAVRVTAVPES
jgi:hypothetical protein